MRSACRQVDEVIGGQTLESNQGFKAVQGLCVVAPPSGHRRTIEIKHQKTQRTIAVSVNDADHFQLEGNGRRVIRIR